MGIRLSSQGTDCRVGPLGLLAMTYYMKKSCVRSGHRIFLCFYRSPAVRFMGQRPRYTDTIKTGKGNGRMEYELVWVREHIEVYDGAGRFCFSADNEREVREELGLVH